MSLSESQIKAIVNAFSCDLSYIQGPPGTGKSHTICAIILTALMQDKKILVVSQKTAACKIIKDKLEPYLSSHSSLGIAYFNSNDKKIIADYCKNFYPENSVKLSLYEEKLKILNEKLKEQESYLKKALQYNEDYVEKHKVFIKKLKEMNKNWFHINKQELLEKILFYPKHLNNIDEYEKLLEKLKIIRDKAKNTLATKLFTNKIKKHLNKHFEVEKEFLEKESDITPFFQNFVELNIAFTEAEKSLEKLKNGYNINGIRMLIRSIKSDIYQVQMEFIKQKIKKSYFKVDDINKFGKMLRFVNPSIVSNKINSINFDNVLEVIPFWTMEIRELGKVFPLKSELFDLVIVDEASQVNLAEIIPAFYRGKNIVIVGDHKQLSLGASGLTFSLSEPFDKFIWNKYSSLQYDSAKDKDLVVSKASILDFLRNDKYNIIIPECMLDEHFRSFPRLANYTNKFYTENNVSMKIMTETPDRLGIDCFSAINIRNGKREQKTIPQEVDCIVQIIKSLLKQGTDEYPFPEHIDKNKFSIGIISMLRDQCRLVKEKLNSVFPNGELNKYGINPNGSDGIGTPEEFQGNERDIIIFSLGLDVDCNHGQGHFQNVNRLNVATSRAKYYTYFVYSPFPKTYNKIYKYLDYIKGVEETDIKKEEEGEKPKSQIILPPLNRDKFESDFERYVCYYLEKFIDEKNITIHNQVTCCGQKRLDFVLVNKENNKFAAIEVDGSYHFVKDSRDYTTAHIERMAILERAGWNVINTPYYLWYNGARLREENDSIFQTEIKRIYKEIENMLY